MNLAEVRFPLNHLHFMNFQSGFSRTRSFRNDFTGADKYENIYTHIHTCTFIKVIITIEMLLYLSCDRNENYNES